MEEEKLIDYETAILANKLGFYKVNVYTPYWIHTETKETVLDGERLFSEYSKYIHQPTQSLLQKWLREIHNIYVQPWIDPYAGDFWFTIIIQKTETAKYNKDSNTNYDNYEEALEEGLKKALTLIS